MRIKIIRNKILPLGPYDAMAFWPFIFTKVELTPQILNHEKIHLEQQKELALVGFYLLYLGNFVYNLIRMHPRPYRAIIFEREAYERQADPKYLESRPKYAWIKYLKR